MNLLDNPIFLTQKRLVHRGGVLAAILIAALVGFSLFSGLITYLADPLYFPSIRSTQDAGKDFYGWTIAVEILVLVIGGFLRISRVLSEERKSGLWDSNRLTPLKPSQIIIGYWFGCPLREFYMSLILAGIGLFIVLFAKLPIILWLGTQILIFSTALLFGLLGALAGMTFQRLQGGIIFLVLFLIIQSFPFGSPKFFITAFLLPVYPILNLFTGNEVSLESQANEMGEWGGFPEIFGLPIYPILISLALQLIVGMFLWQAITRKTANPFRPGLFRWEAMALFTILLVCQHGLIWGLWQGHFPHLAKASRFYVPHDSAMQCVHIGTIVLALIILASFSPKPESVRLKVLRSGIKTSGIIFSTSSVSLAIWFAAISALVLSTQFLHSLTDWWQIYLIAVGNSLAFTLIFSLLLEFCRLRHKRRSLSFLALWLFVLCVMPFILAGVFGNSVFGELSLFSPGCAAMTAGTEDQDLNSLLGIVGVHLLIAVVLFIAWRREWQKLLARAT